MAEIFEYAPAPESRSVVSLRENYGLFVDGGFAPAESGWWSEAD